MTTCHSSTTSRLRIIPIGRTVIVRFIHFSHQGKDESRRTASTLVAQGKIKGFLAYDDREPVGWCNAARRTNYPALHWLMGAGPDLWERVGSIVCFVVAATHRNQGVATLLLDTACKKFSE